MDGEPEQRSFRKGDDPEDMEVGKEGREDGRHRGRG